MVSEESFNHYKVGDEHTDAVHWNLVSHMNSAIMFLKQKQVDAALKEIKILREALVPHLKEEEEFMESIQFPFLAAHRKEHVRILSELDKIPNMISQKNTVSEHVVSQFEMIIMSHIDHYDMQIANFMHK